MKVPKVPVNEPLLSVENFFNSQYEGGMADSKVEA